MKTKSFVRKHKKKQCVLKKQYNCTVCMETKAPNTKAKLTCGHEFCGDCIQKWAKRESSCPLCRKSFDSYRYKGRTVKVKQKKQGNSLMELVVITTTEFLECEEYREHLRGEVLEKKPGVTLLVLCIYRALQILAEDENREEFANTDLDGAIATAEELLELIEEV